MAPMPPAVKTCLRANGIASCCTPSSSGDARIADTTALTCTSSEAKSRASCESGSGALSSSVACSSTRVKANVTSCGQAGPNSRNAWSSRSGSSAAAAAMEATVGSGWPHVRRCPPRFHAAAWHA
eukprot:3000043-Prymnesium_polylepis.2